MQATALGEHSTMTSAAESMVKNKPFALPQSAVVLEIFQHFLELTQLF